MQIIYYYIQIETIAIDVSYAANSYICTYICMYMYAYIFHTKSLIVVKYKCIYSHV